MTFKLFLLWSLFLLGRPQDLLTFLQPMRPVLLLTAMTMCGMILGSQSQKLLAVFSMPETKRYVLLFVIMLVGIPFAYHRRVAFEFVFLVYLPNILFFVALITQIDSLKKLKSLVLIISISAWLYSFFGYLHGSSWGGRFAIYGAMFDANDIVYVLISLFPLCFFFLYLHEGLLKKLFSIITIGSSITVVLLTGSRGGMVGLVAVLAIMLLTKTAGIRISHKIAFLGLIAGAAILLGDKINMERYLTLTDIQSDYNMYDELGRKKIWQHAIALTLDNPVTGVGVNCFSMALGYRREELGLLPKWQTTHNSFLQISAETGLVGFVLFVSINLRTLLTFFRASRIEPETDEAREIRVLGSLMLLGFIGNLVVGFFLSQGWSVFFTLFFALAAVLQRLQAQLVVSEGTDQSNVRAGARVAMKRFSRIGAV